MAPTVSIVDLRGAIAEAVASNEKMYDIETVCRALNLDIPNQIPYNSKRVWVQSSLVSKTLEELIPIGERVLARYPDSRNLELLLMQARRSSIGVEGSFKNIIFASDGPKPDLVLTDAINNTIEVVANAQYCLIYDAPIRKSGLLWVELSEWWAKRDNLPFPSRDTERSLFRRLKQSIESPVEKIVFDTYYKIFRDLLNDRLPALLPQVYLHYDPKTLKELRSGQRLPRQRMDFLILFSESERVVIEIDGKQHYSSEDGYAKPELYAQMVAEDRKLRLLGYEIYRFGGHELSQSSAQQLVTSFFQRLFLKHNIVQ